MAEITIPRGATLSGLARENKTTVQELLRLNPNITNPDLIFAGEQLSVPDAAPQTQAPVSAPVVTPPPQTFDAGTLTTPTKPVEIPQLETVDTSRQFVESTQAPQIQAQQAFQDTRETTQDVLTRADQIVEPLQTERQGLIGRIERSLGRLSGRGARQAEVEAASGIPESQRKLEEINLQIAQRRGEFEKAIAAIPGQGRGITTPIVAGQQARARRQQAVEIGALTSVGQALQGNIALAQQTAQRTVDLEFEPVEQEIANLKLLLDINRENLSLAERRRAEQLELELNERQSRIDQEKEDRLNILNFATEAAQSGADNTMVNRILQSRTPQEALSVGSEFLAQPAQRKTQIIEVGGNTQLVDTQTGEVITDFGSSATPFEKQQQDLKLQEQRLKNDQLSRESGIAPLGSTGGNANIGDFMQALQTQESGGDPSAVNARTGASGLFQIMPANWPVWAREAGLSEGAPQTPENQQIVASNKINQYFNKYGNWADVASVWYSGRPFSQVVSEGWADRPQGPTGAEPSVRQYVTQVLSRLPEQRRFVSDKEARSLNKEVGKSDAFKALTTARGSLEKLANYERIFKEVGNQKFGPEAQRLRTAYRATLLDLKEFFNLGVLNGPDLELMESLLVNPNINALTDPIEFRKIGGREGIQESITEMKKSILEHAQGRFVDLETSYRDSDPNQITNLLNARRTIEELNAINL